MTPAPALEVRVSWRAADGTVHRRERWCWTATPPAGDVLARLARAALAARREGLAVRVDEPVELAVLAHLQGLISR